VDVPTCLPESFLERFAVGVEKGEGEAALAFPTEPPEDGGISSTLQTTVCSRDVSFTMACKLSSLPVVRPASSSHLGP
jgi:hypothetical protein